MLYAVGCSASTLACVYASVANACMAYTASSIKMKLSNIESYYITKSISLPPSPYFGV